MQFIFEVVSGKKSETLKGKVKFNELFLSMCVSQHWGQSVNESECSAGRNQEEGIGSPRAGVTGGFEMPNLRGSNCPPVLYRSSEHS